MNAFADLYRRLDETTGTNRKVAAMVDYFNSTPPADAIWAVHFLIGRKPRQAVPVRRLSQWAADTAGIPDWLFEACYDSVGDLAETITLILPSGDATSDRPLHWWVERRLLPLREQSEDEKQQSVLRAWAQMDRSQRFVWNKLITGGFRVGVSRKLVTRALSECSGVSRAVIAHRLMGDWTPTADTFRRLLSTDTEDADDSRPYPFCLAYPLDRAPETLGDPGEWHVEWKWDGIRAQVIRRSGQVFVWSRGEEPIGDAFPEIREAAGRLPDGTVLDGEILPWRERRPLAFSKLQKRIGRKSVTRKIMQEVPLVFMAYDMLEEHGRDLRGLPLWQRRARLQSRLSELPDAPVMLSPTVAAADWDELDRRVQQARDLGVEGVMLKHRASAYRVGRRRGDWWKWKVDPLTVDAVLIYAQRGHGRRSGLYTDYTFAVWDGDRLVPIAKAYSGLTDAEIRRVDRFVRRHTVERFGPVRSVAPELVFEIAFEDIRRSTRHKSGVAVRFPRIARWRADKSIRDADTLDTVRALLTVPEGRLSPMAAEAAP